MQIKYESAENLYQAIKYLHNQTKMYKKPFMPGGKRNSAFREKNYQVTQVKFFAQIDDRPLRTTEKFNFTINTQLESIPNFSVTQEEDYYLIKKTHKDALRHIYFHKDSFVEIKFHKELNIKNNFIKVIVYNEIYDYETGEPSRDGKDSEYYKRIEEKKNA